MPDLQRYTFERLVPRSSSVLAMHQRHHDIAVHWHDYYELVYVLDGQSTHVCNGERERVSAGSVMLLGPTDFHAFEAVSAQPVSCYNVVIDARTAERHLLSLLPASQRMGPWSIAGFDEARPDFHRLWEESVGAELGSAQLREALLAVIFVALARRLAGQQRDGGERGGGPVRRRLDADPIRAALFYVDQHFREPLTLGQVAAHSYLSPNYFSERFHEVTGLPFQTYLQHARLRFARSLLTSTDISVTEAALASGFNGVSHFGRAYRARYGCAPSSDRTRHDGATSDDQAVA